MSDADEESESQGESESKPRTEVWNGVAVPTVPPEEGRDYVPEMEAATSDALRRRVRRGDDVVVVGGGKGITTVVAARMTHFEGSVATFEANAEMLTTLRRTVRVNRVADLVTLEHAAVGPVRDGSRDQWGPPDGDRLAPRAIPECDVLELDCEGAEREILQGLEARPRIIVVETHEPIGVPPEEVEQELAKLGYDVVNRQSAGLEGELDVLTAVRSER
jgi:antitoxin (DNA-binding transcriptional repressor) of toxin-antitoxin stability system